MRLQTRYVEADRAVLRLSRYQDGSRAIEILDERGSPLVRATVCLVGYDEAPAPGNVFIKNWSENEGVLESLQRAGIVGEVVRTVPCGYVEAHEVPLLFS